MRIISGSARGTKLLVPKGLEIRPVLDAVRESLFNILEGEGLEEKKVLDLFAGTGSLGLEALSRGAAACTFVERLPAALKALEKNLEKAGLSQKGAILRGDALFVYSRSQIQRGSFDLIFADPPYRYLEPGKTREAFLSLLGELFKGSILSREGRVIIGHREGLLDDVIPSPGACYDRRKYSTREMSFYSREE